MKRWVIGILIAVLVAMMIGYEWSGGAPRFKDFELALRDFGSSEDQSDAGDAEEVSSTIPNPSVLEATAESTPKPNEPTVIESDTAQSAGAAKQSAIAVPGAVSADGRPGKTKIYFMHSIAIFRGKKPSAAELENLEQVLAKMVQELGGAALVLDADFNADKNRPTLLYGRDAFDLTDEIRRRMFLVADTGR